MGFNRMSEYSENNLPRCGVASDYTLCESINSYIPYDVSGASGIVSSLSSSVGGVVSSNTKSLNSSIRDLDDAWGSEFISIDGKGLDIVSVSDVEVDFQDVEESVNEQVSRCEKLVSDIISRLNEVKEYVKKLQDNLDKYKALKEKKNSLVSQVNSLISSFNSIKASPNPNKGTLDSLNDRIINIDSSISKLNEKINLYESSKIEEPDGGWIVE